MIQNFLKFSINTILLHPAPGILGHSKFLSWMGIILPFSFICVSRRESEKAIIALKLVSLSVLGYVSNMMDVLNPKDHSQQFLECSDMRSNHDLL